MYATLLILAMSQHGGGPVAIDFQSMRDCEKASAAIAESAPSGIWLHMTCINNRTGEVRPQS